MHTKYFFKITLVLQLLTLALATYGHPDAEVFSLPGQPTRDQLIIEAAIKRGMDGTAVAELLRTKAPVVRSTITPNGFTKTTTYTLQPDGSISSKSVLRKRNHFVYNSENMPDELKNSPTGSITRTYTDSNGNKVTKTVAVNQPKSETVSDSDDLTDDWFSKSFPSWQDEPHAPSKPIHTAHKTITRVYNGPQGERRTVQTWSSEPEFTEPELHNPIYKPVSTSTSTRTYIKPNGEKHVVETTSSNLPQDPVGDAHWPNFDYSAFSQPWDNLEPANSEGWEVINEPETTTKLKPNSRDRTITTSTAKPKLFIQSEPTNHKSLPDLNEFLRSQYGPTGSTVKTTTYKIPQAAATTTPKPLSSTPTIIKIEDLPVVEVLHNGKPASESILKTLPTHLTPRTPAEHVLHIENKHPIDNFEKNLEEATTSTVTTNRRTYSKTHIGPEKPTLRDLDPQMQDILRNAGIVPEIEGDSVTKTRKEPDGRIITTSYNVNTVPLDYASHTGASSVPHYKPAPTFNYAGGSQPSSYNPLNLSKLTPHLSPITDFLAKLGLTKFDISSRNGRYTRTFIDENGDILTATFVLSTPHGIRGEA